MLGGVAPAAAVDAPLRLSRSQRPDDGPAERLEKQGRQIALHAEGDYSAWSYADTWLSGIYTATLGPPFNRSQSFAVNVDTRESDLAAVDVEDLKGNVWPGIPFQYQTTWQQTDAQVAAPVVRSWRLPVLLLYAVLGLWSAKPFWPGDSDITAHERHPSNLVGAMARHQGRAGRGYVLAARSPVALAALGDVVAGRGGGALRGGDLRAGKPPRRRPLPRRAGGHAAGADRPGDADDRPGVASPCSGPACPTWPCWSTTR